MDPRSCSTSATAQPAGRRRIVVTLVLTFVALLAIGHEQASAVLGGSNGRIVFVSGRGEPSDDTAKLYLRTVTSGVGAGVASPTITPEPGVQHRHPTWSPDRTKVAYARGGPFCAAPKCDIFVLDLTTPGATPTNITNSPNVNEDRPAWAPDGKYIAYESEVTNGSNQLDVIFVPPPGEPPQTPNNITGTPALTESKPAWSPDSETIFYARGNPSVPPSGPPPVSVDLYSEPSSNSGTATLAIPDSGLHEFQPSISPDGTKICFTLGTGFNATATVMLGELTQPPTPAQVFANEPGGNFNCTFSPDGKKIAYVNGTFGNGALVMKNADFSGGFVTLEEIVGRFDGNPEWAPDGRPICRDSIATTQEGVPVEVVLGCEDSGPEYERSPVRVDVPTDGEPSHGSVGDVTNGPPARVTYTPEPGFSGSDSFRVRPRDDIGFGPGRGTVRVTVTPKPKVELPRKDSVRIVRIRKNRRTGIARLTVHVSGPGLLRIAGTKRIKAVRTRASSPGRLALRLVPKRRTKRLLAKRGRAKVNARLSYLPDGGTPLSRKITVKLQRRVR